MVKINVDAAVGKNTRRGSVAAVARSELGVFMGASAIVFPGCTTAETLEAMACREAIALAKDIHARRVKVATDCQNVVRSLDEGTMGVYAHIAREINEARGDFEELVISYEGRRSNKDAHNLARSVVNNNQGRSVWLVIPRDGCCISVSES
jgi:ribonuclease HI